MGTCNEREREREREREGKERTRERKRERKREREKEAGGGGTRGREKCMRKKNVCLYLITSQLAVTFDRRGKEAKGER